MRDESLNQILKSLKTLSKDLGRKGRGRLAQEKHKTQEESKMEGETVTEDARKK